jgi:hypothetical protein
MIHALGQRVGAHAIAAAVLLITASALIWVGVGFAGYAIFLAFQPRSGAPWAAAFAAAILVVAPLGWAAIVNIRAPRRVRLHTPDERVTPVADENATLSLLARVAQEKPLLALVFAGIIGASEAILHRKD